MCFCGTFYIIIIQISNDMLSLGTITAGKSIRSPENLCLSAHSWVGSVAVCRSSDLAASGAGNGSIRLWEIESDSKGIQPLFELPQVSLHGHEYCFCAAPI